MTRVRVVSLSLAAILAPAILPAQSGVARLGWLAGCWQRDTPTSTVEEQWMSPRGGTMLGMGRTVRRDTTIAWELLRIDARGDTLVYHALPSGQAPAQFAQAGLTDSSVVFENVAHDFPQRIRYVRRGADSLLARIEGVQDGVTRGVDFRFRRVACP
jgi:hypothetical protein